MEQDFIVMEERLEECKAFIRSLPSARFKHNPIRVGSIYHISVSMNVQDGNKLNELFEKWYNEDNPIVPKKNVFKNLLKSLFK